MKGRIGAGLAVLLSSSLAVGQTPVSDAPAEAPGPKEEAVPKEEQAPKEEPIPSSQLRPQADTPVAAPPAGAAPGGSQDSPSPPSEPSEKAPPAPSATDAAQTGEGPASQAPRVTEEPKETVTEVRVIGSKPDGMRRLPGSGTLVTEREIQRAEPYDVAEMLRRVPGVQARQDFGAGMRLDISIRGLEAGRSRRVLILEDGVPQGNNPYGEPDLYAQPAIERMRGMEVVKGSGSILFGPQTTGGVINFLTKIPPPHRRTLVDVEGGDRNYVRGIASYGDTFGSARYITQASYKQGSGVRGAAFHSTDTFAKFAMDTSSQGELTLKLGFHDDGAISDAVGLPRDVYLANPKTPVLAAHDYSSLQRYDVSAMHEHRVDANVTLKTLAYAYRIDRVWRRQNYSRVFDPEASYERYVGDPNLPGGVLYFLNSNTVLDRSYNVQGVEPRAEIRWVSGDVEHRFETGARVLTEYAHYSQRAGTTIETFAGSTEFEEEHRSYAGAAFVQDRISFLPELVVTPGLRVEHATFGRTVLRQKNADGVEDVNVRGTTKATGLIPGIGLVYGGRKAHVFGGLHVGWAPPRVSSSISPTGMSNRLDPEESTNYEVGTRLAPKPWLSAEGTAFLSLFRNQVISNTSSDTNTTEQTNAGPTRILGFEGATTFSLGRWLKWPTSLDFGARYTFSRATFVGGPYNGNSLPYAPQHSFNTNVDVEAKFGLGGQLAFAYVGPQFSDAEQTVAVDATGRVGRIEGRKWIDATVHYKHAASGLSGRITVKNALDEIVVLARRPEGIFPGGYRQIIAGIRWDFDR